MSRRAAPPPPSEFKVGQECDAYWLEDDAWFDGVIEEIGTDTIKVRYVDYNESYDVPNDWVQAKAPSSSLSSSSPPKPPAAVAAPRAPAPPPPRARAQTSTATEAPSYDRADPSTWPAHARPPPDSVRKHREKGEPMVNASAFARALMSKQKEMTQNGVSVTTRTRNNANRELQVMAAEAGEWMSKILGRSVCNLDLDDVASDLVAKLGTGIELCLLIQKMCQTAKPEVARACKMSLLATKGSFKARDNIHNFLVAAEQLGVPQLSLFETEDVVQEREHRRIVDCFLKLAKLAVEFGVEPPTIVKFEMELDRSDDGNSDDGNVAREPVPPNKLERSKHELDRDIGALMRLNGVNNVDLMRVPHRDNYYWIAPKGELDRNSMMVAIRKVRSCLLVRVGGGWQDFVEFIERRLTNLPRQVGISRKPSAKKMAVGNGVTAHATNASKDGKVVRLKKSAATKQQSPAPNPGARKTKPPPSSSSGAGVTKTGTRAKRSGTSAK